MQMLNKKWNVAVNVYVNLWLFLLMIQKKRYFGKTLKCKRNKAFVKCFFFFIGNWFMTPHVRCPKVFIRFINVRLIFFWNLDFDIGDCLCHTKKWVLYFGLKYSRKCLVCVFKIKLYSTENHPGISYTSHG